MANPGLLAAVLAEVDAAAVFVALLGEEQGLLRDARADALDALLERKNQEVDRLAAASARRNATLAAAGLPPDRAGMEAALQQATADRALHEAWQRLTHIAAEGKRLNEQNGELIRLHLHHNGKLLDALLAASGRQSLYTAAGQSQGRVGSRLIDSA